MIVRGAKPSILLGLNRIRDSQLDSYNWCDGKLKLWTVNWSFGWYIGIIESIAIGSIPNSKLKFLTVNWDNLILWTVN